MEEAIAQLVAWHKENYSGSEYADAMYEINRVLEALPNIEWLTTAQFNPGSANFLGVVVEGGQLVIWPKPIRVHHKTGVRYQAEISVYLERSDAYPIYTTTTSSAAVAIVAIEQAPR